MKLHTEGRSGRENVEEAKVSQGDEGDRMGVVLEGLGQ